MDQTLTRISCKFSILTKEYVFNSVKGLPRPWKKVLIGEEIGDGLLFDMRLVHNGTLI
jgi:hypothetical protein